MNTNPAFLSPWQPQLLAILRITTGYMYLLHGTAKLLQVPHVPSLGNVDLFSLMGLAGVLETVGGLLIIVGLLTRPAAFILSGEMAVAYFMVFAPKDPLLPWLNGGESAALFCFVFLYLSAAGAGAWSVDNALSRPRAAAVT